VSSGDIIAEMDADKATVEIEAAAAGVLIAQSVQPGDEISEGAVIGQLGEAGEAPAKSEAPAKDTPAKKDTPSAEASAADEEPTAVPQPTPSSGNGAQARTDDNGRVKVSPIARRIAEERGIDLRQVGGSGPGGRIVKADVEMFQTAAAPAKSAPGAAASASFVPSGLKLNPDRTPPPESDEVEYLELSTMRRRIAATTIESQQTIPHFYVTTEIDVADLMAMRQELNASVPEGGTRISVNDLVVKATALTLRDFPNLNSHFYGDRIVHFKRINIGIAVALPAGGVMYVVAHDADKVALGTLAAENKAIALRAREGKVKPADFQGATFSTSNLGIFDVEHFAAVISPPEAGVLAFGTAKKVPVVNEDGTLGVGQRMNVTISVDHRISDGAEGAAYLQAFKELLENPMRLLI
jgi:pyruvate dehydrogenase E2 component (dihydrolipoamide acetyltransferase)